ncbi:MAG TPA: hypothetical protein VGR92_06245 [Steroidobacteraceae bacterium]|nr:hypothetical protein [Steroidobacteraceae bacterium]
MILQSAQAMLPPALTRLALGLHITGGMFGLLAGTVAVFSGKGARLHRVAGTIFFASMLVMAGFADYLAVAIPDQIPNLFIGTFAIYLVTTAWLTVRRREGTTGFAEKLALVVILCLCLPFAVLSFEVAAGLTPSVRSATPIKGPVAIAVYVFTFLMALGAIGDARMLWAGGIAGARRIGRHLWRMCFGFTLAVGSAFTNGLPRLLPNYVHVPLLLLFIPQLAALGLLAFWAVRVRFTGWYSRLAPNIPRVTA